MFELRSYSMHKGDDVKAEQIRERNIDRLKLL